MEVEIFLTDGGKISNVKIDESLSNITNQLNKNNFVNIGEGIYRSSDIKGIQEQ